MTPSHSCSIKRQRWCLWVVLASLLLTSCFPGRPPATPTPDERAIQTRVAATLTALALRASATPLPPPTDTATPSIPTATATETPLPATATWTATAVPTASPTTIPTWTPVITDWRGEYYANRDLSGAPVAVRNDVNIAFNWGQGSPGYGLGPDSYSVRWTRSLNFDGVPYRFSVYVDDGARLWLDDELIINAWYDSGPHTVSAVRSLVSGAHRIRLEYYEHLGTALVQLSWQKEESYPDWKGEYWSNRDVSGSAAVVRNDPSIDFQWGAGAPLAGLPADNFSARWTRSTSFEKATYRFHAVVDDGVRIWVDDVLILDAWYDGAAREVTADYALVQTVHRVRVEYYEHAGGAQIKVWWEKVASPSYPDWRGEYWSNRDLSGSSVLVRNDRVIDFDWGAQAAAPGLPADNFSVRWTHRFDFETGVYRFSTRADDGIRVYLDGQLLIDDWRDGGAQDVYSAEATLAGAHDLTVEYYEHTGLAVVRFWWTLVRSGPTRD